MEGCLAMPDNPILKQRTEADAIAAGMTVQRWGGLACFVLAAALLVSSLLYLTGNLQTDTGPLAYALADFLSGPLWAASLITALLALRDRIGEAAPRRLDLALLAAFVAAGAMVAVACIRSANRHYHVTHPDLNLEMSTTVLVVWATLVAGMIGTGWHFMGWVLLLVGSAGWTTRRLPRPLSALHLAAGTLSLFVYALPDVEASAVALVVVLSIWQGIVLWGAERGGPPSPEIARA